MDNDFEAAHLAALRPGLARRGFVMTSLIAGFTAATAHGAAAQVIHTDTQGLVAGEVQIPVADGKLPGYFAHPATGANWPVVLVVEEIFGVHEYIKDVVRRLAKAGYFAVAPELYARIADLSKMTDASVIVRDVIAKAPDDTMLSDLDASAAWAASQGADAGALGVVGFCWGGRDVWLYAAHNPHLKAAVSFYGFVESPKTPVHPLNAMDVAGDLKAPLLGLYGAKDAGNPPEKVHAAQEKARAAGKTVEIVMYPDAGHGFHADYRPSYVAADAEDAWKRALAWFKTHGVG
ncbi:MAG: dienelactone hydrolase family protein [Proteobacteria bacterium]|nr:dienelactone hydrolase family protein [Pseudomonadota bacterium]